MPGLGVKVLGDPRDQRTQEIQGDNAMLLGFSLENFDHISLYQAEDDKCTGLGCSGDNAFCFRGTPNFRENPELPGTSELEHRRTHRCGPRVACPIGDHENLHRGLFVGTHATSLADEEKKPEFLGPRRSSVDELARREHLPQSDVFAR